MLHDCPDEVRLLWESLLNQVAVDTVGTDEAGSAQDPVWAQRMFDSIASDVFGNKGPRMAICQWLAWFRCTKHWDKRFHRRLFGYILLGLHYGYFTGSASGRSLAAVAIKPAAHVDGVKSLSANRKAGASLQLGKTALHSVAILYNESWRLQRPIRGLIVMVEPLEYWYNRERTSNKNHEQVLTFYTEMAGVKAYEPLVAIFKQLTKADNLVQLGLASQESDLPLGVLSKDARKALVAEETIVLENLMRGEFCIVGYRLRSLLWHVQGLPGLAATPMGPHRPHHGPCRQ